MTNLNPNHSPSTVNVIIPALNEAQSIAHVLRAIPRQEVTVDEIIVVDNGSVDQTAAIAADPQYGATVLHEPRSGYGQACLCALAYIATKQATKQSKKPDIIVFLDADYSDHPEEMTLLLQPILADNADFVTGSRVLGKAARGAMNLPQRWGNGFAVWLLYWLYGVKATDLGPFRAIRYAALCRLGLQDTNYGWNVEMQIKALRAGLRFQEVPVSYRKRIGTSKISGTIAGVVGAGYKIIYTLLKYR